MSKIQITAFWLGCMFLSSCAVLSKKDYKQIVDEKDALSNYLIDCKMSEEMLTESISKLEADTARLSEQLFAVQLQYTKLQSEYETHKTASESEQKRLLTAANDRDKKMQELETLLKLRNDANLALEEKVKQSAFGIDNSKFSIEVRNGKVYILMSDNALFDSGSIDIDYKGQMALSELAVILQEHPNVKIYVEGHTDTDRIGNMDCVQDNWDLSALRATAVVRYLTVTENVNPQNVIATGHSMYDPIDNSNTWEAKAKNRRIEIVLAPRLEEIMQFIEANPTDLNSSSNVVNESNSMTPIEDHDEE